MKPQSGGAGPLRSEFADDPEMGELVRMFVDELPQRIDELRTFHDQGELERVRRIAHQLKGASAGYGFPAVGELAAELEHAASAESHARDLAARVNELIHLCGRVVR